MCSHAPRFNSARRRHIRILSERRSTFAGRSHLAIDVDDQPACPPPLPLASRSKPQPAACLDFTRFSVHTPAVTVTQRHCSLGAPANIGQRLLSSVPHRQRQGSGAQSRFHPEHCRCLRPITVVCATFFTGYSCLALRSAAAGPPRAALQRWLALQPMDQRRVRRFTSSGRESRRRALRASHAFAPGQFTAPADVRRDEIQREGVTNPKRGRIYRFLPDNTHTRPAPAPVPPGW